MADAPGIQPHRSTPIEAIFTVLFVAVAAVSWSALVLAEFGVFSGLRVLAAGAAITAVVGFAARHELRAAVRFGMPGPRLSWVPLSVALACSAIVASQPGECLLDGRDASVYVAIARTIERTGGIVSADPLREIVGGDTLDPLLARDTLWPHDRMRFPGGIQIPDGSDRMVPLFHHLVPAWIATISSLTGPRGGYFTNAIFGTLGVFALWLVGRRAWSPVAGAVAAALVAVSFGQILYSRLTVSEIPAQYLMLAGVFFTLQAWDTRSRLAGGCAGAAIGLAAFTRIDALVVLVPLATVVLVYARRRGLFGPAWRWYAVALAAVGSHATAHALLVSRPYTLRVAGAAWNAFEGRLGQSAVGIFLAAAAVTGVLVLTVTAVRYAHRAAPRLRSWALLAGMGAVLAIAGWPAVAMAGRLLSPAGVTAALAGLAVMLWRGNRPRVFLVAAPLVADVLLFGTWPEAAGLNADFRRLVPSILPLSALLVGVLVSEASSWKPPAARAIWALPAGLAAFWLWQAWPMLETPPLQDLHRRVEEVANRLPPDAVVLSDWSVPSHLTLALQSGFGRVSLPIVERPATAAPIGALVDRVLQAGRPVFVIIGGYEGEIRRRLWRSDLEGFEVTGAGQFSFRYTVAAPLFAGFPRPVPTISRRIELYRIVRPAEPAIVPLPLAIDVGDFDFRWVLRGFYGPEQIGDARGRWTAARAEVALPRLAGGSSPIALLIRLAGHRPRGFAGPTVRLSIDGTPAGTIDHAGQEFDTYQIALDARLAERLRAGPATLAIEVDVFVPKDAGLGDDSRVLGVLVDWLRLE